MKVFSILFMLLCSFSVQAEGVYSSVDEYVQAATKVKINANEDNYKEHYRVASKNKRWHVGFASEVASNTGFLYVLEANKQGKLKLESKSHSAPEDMKWTFFVDEITMYANDGFSVTFGSGQSRSTYDFQLRENKWFLISEVHTELAQCGEGENSETSYSLQTSTNYLTGEIEEQRYREKDCKPLKLVKKKRKFSLVPLSDFYPFMEIEPNPSFKRDA